MSEESTIPEPIELVRRQVVRAIMSYPDVASALDALKAEEL
jgi:hypothetical protein